jgi:hypothetical protein
MVGQALRQEHREVRHPPPVPTGAVPAPRRPGVGDLHDEPRRRARVGSAPQALAAGVPERRVWAVLVSRRSVVGWRVARVCAAATSRAQRGLAAVVSAAEAASLLAGVQAPARAAEPAELSVTQPSPVTATPGQTQAAAGGPVPGREPVDTAVADARSRTATAHDGHEITMRGAAVRARKHP